MPAGPPGSGRNFWQKNANFVEVETRLLCDSAAHSEMPQPRRKFASPIMKTKSSTKAREAQKRPVPERRHPTGRRTGSRPRRNAIDGAGGPVVPAKWRWHYRTLVALRDRFLADRSEKLHQSAEGIEPHSLHIADSATDEFDHDMAMALLAFEQGTLSEVEDAIQRIHAGTFGVCEATGKRIPADRLRAVPWARYAHDTEQQLEKSGAVPKAHLGDAVSLRGSDAVIPETNEFEQSEEPDAEETQAEVAAAEVRGEVNNRELTEVDRIEPATAPEAGRRTPSGHWDGGADGRPGPRAGSR